MSHRFSELVGISKVNGDFKRNYGKLIGASLYLRSIGAARGRSLIWTGCVCALGSVGVCLAETARIPLVIVLGDRG
jgi:hypothetical protein